MITKALRMLAMKATHILSRFNLDGRGYVSSSGSYSGMWVDRDKALTSATFFAGMNLIGGTIAHLGFDVYQEKKSGSRSVVSGHSLHEVLKYEPNSHSTAMEFWQRLIWDQELCGNGYAKIIRNSSGVIGLAPWEPDRVKLNTDKPGWVYEYQPPSGGPDKLPEWNADIASVLHLRNVTIDGVYGISTVDLARQRIGLDLAVEKYGAMFFGKGGRVKDIFATDGVQTLKPHQRTEWKAIFGQEYGNSETFHEAMLLEAGIRPVGKSGATPNEAQFIETQIQSAIVLCRFLGIPPTLVGILDRATYNNQEQLMLQFLTLCLMPRIERIEQAARRALLTREEKRQGFFIHSKAQKILRGDQKARGEFYKTLMSLGALNAEEVRDLEDMPRIGTPEAAEYVRAQNIFGPPAVEEAAAEAGAEAGADAARRAA